MTAVEPSASRPPVKPLAPAARPVVARRDNLPEPLPEFLEDEAPRTPLRFLWGLLALIALLGLAAQLLLYFRSDVALRMPELRPYLVEGCKALGCKVNLPRRPQLMSIESSDLQANPGHENRIVLNAVIRNRAPFPQQYPDLELTLTDESGQPVVRRVLVPTDYIAAPRGQSKATNGAIGIGPGAEVIVRLHFDTSLVRATGYRLYLFFP